MTASKLIPCPVCGDGLAVRPAHGRKSGKAFINLVCPTDGRHFRGFINDKAYVEAVFARLDRLYDAATQDESI